MLENPSLQEVQADTRSPTASSVSLNLMLRENRVVGTLLGITAFLLLAGMVCVISRYYGLDFFGRDLFDLDAETNVPATFSALILLLAAVILGVIAAARGQAGRADAFSWRALTGIFAYLALDEATMLHERLDRITSSLVSTDGFLHYAWVLPYGILGLVVLALFLRFLLQLPANIRWRVVLAGVIYVGGAMGVEMIGGAVVTTLSEESLPARMLTVLEEGMEMLGVILFIGALLSYIRLYLPGLQLRLGLAPTTPAPSSGD